jgi:hypothetical protein
MTLPRITVGTPNLTYEYAQVLNRIDALRNTLQSQIQNLDAKTTSNHVFISLNNARNSGELNNLKQRTIICENKISQIIDFLHSYGFSLQ